MFVLIFTILFVGANASSLCEQCECVDDVVNCIAKLEMGSDNKINKADFFNIFVLHLNVNCLYMEILLSVSNAISTTLLGSNMAIKCL